MKYREIPHTDILVSAIGLGTMTWGEQNTQEQGFEQMDYALEQGVNLFDTAEMYPVPPKAKTCNQTERIIGNWLAERGTRDQVVLATKVAGPGAHVSHIRNGEGFSRENLSLALEGSLARLQTDRIDLYQLHWPSRPVPLFGGRDFSQPMNQESDFLEETLEILGDFQKDGKVRYFGLSNETPWGVMKCLELAKGRGLPRMITIQNSYNLLNRCFDGGLSEICHYEGIKLLAYSPLAFGRLSGKYRGGRFPKGARLTLWERFSRYNGSNADAAIEEYAGIAEAAGLDLAQMCLAWVTDRFHVASNLIGATTMEQLKSNIGSIKITLSEDVIRAIDKVHLRIPNPCP